MKTTNYEISKRLHELGFETESNYIWTKGDAEQKEEPRCLFWFEKTTKAYYDIYAYDLETLIESLPEWIENKELKDPSRYFLSMNKKRIWYCLKFYEETQNNESLADTAGRLLIKLIEEGIVEVSENRLKKSIEQLESGKVIRKSLSALKTEFEEGE